LVRCTTSNRDAECRLGSWSHAIWSGVHDATDPVAPAPSRRVDLVRDERTPADLDQRLLVSMPAARRRSPWPARLCRRHRSNASSRSNSSRAPTPAGRRPHRRVRLFEPRRSHPALHAGPTSVPTNRRREESFTAVRPGVGRERVDRGLSWQTPTTAESITPRMALAAPRRGSRLCRYDFETTPSRYLFARGPAAASGLRSQSGGVSPGNASDQARARPASVTGPVLELKADVRAHFLLES